MRSVRRTKGFVVGEMLVQQFISEDDLNTFEGWLRYQAVDVAKATPEELAMCRGLIHDAREFQ